MFLKIRWAKAACTFPYTRIGIFCAFLAMLYDGTRWSGILTFCGFVLFLSQSLRVSESRESWESQSLRTMNCTIAHNLVSPDPFRWKAVAAGEFLAEVWVMLHQLQKYVFAKQGDKYYVWSPNVAPMATQTFATALDRCDSWRKSSHSQYANIKCSWEEGEARLIQRKNGVQ